MNTKRPKSAYSADSKKNMALLLVYFLLIRSITIFMNIGYIFYSILFGYPVPFIPFIAIPVMYALRNYVDLMLYKNNITREFWLKKE